MTCSFLSLIQEQALEVADIMVKSGGIDVLVIDSVAALVPRAEIEVKWEIIMLAFKLDSCHKHLEK